MPDSKDTRQQVDAELFEALDEGLRSVFDKSVKENDTGYGADRTCGTAAAQAARALIELHRDLKPRY